MTPEEEKAIRHVVDHGWRLFGPEAKLLMDEVDGLRAEIRHLQEEIQRLRDVRDVREGRIYDTT